MPARNLEFKCALVTGGGGGIGRAISEWLISERKEVIIVGRTESKLKSTAEEIGAATYYTLDTGDIPSVTPFIKQLISEHPEVDCLINNAGVQRPLQVLQDKPQEFLQKADQEIDINIRGPMHLTLGFLEHFKSKPNGGLIVNVSSVLGYVPFSVVNPVYNGTKAWVHFWSLNLRTQLKDTNIRVLEIAPPTVATDLHRERSDPDDNKKEKNSNALTVDEFIERVVKQWKGGSETIGAGMSEKILEKWGKEFGSQYEQLTR
ncbi:NAD(P)-binding protein [Glonium stellatum]|uniref:NAD(P)-binding protein n=1 Tax=Glonium stellatum TaxID=574774 RepID=A0A8E2F6R8_9PEZI|nr:NAD(P)-binding protein [Glonium stellatum]